MRIAIIGAGIGGLMAAYSLQERTDFIVDIYDKGPDITSRSCPLLQHKVDKCVNCEYCNIMSGVGGAGAFSDGKFNITTEYGGKLPSLIGDSTVLDYIEKVDRILCRHGATREVYYPDDELKCKCLQHGLYMQQAICKHLGTDMNYATMRSIVNSLLHQDNVNIFTSTNIIDVDYIYHKDEVKEVISVISECDGKQIHIPYNKVIFAVGRAGASFFVDWCNRHHVDMTNNQVDIGVRVELPSMIWSEYEEKIYEPKILYRTQQYGDVVRMFCFNGRGEVVTENTDGILTVNGHAYAAEELKTKNTNFALLSTINFTEPFDKPIDYAKHIAQLSNMVSGGSVIVQRLGDLERGRRTDKKRLQQSTTKPTLTSAIPGDLSLCIPKRQLDNIIEMLHKLDEVVPGTANYDTLLYGVECKYYSASPLVDYSSFELVTMPNMYAIGDGAGFTRSLAQAGAHGLFVANSIKKMHKK